MTKPSSRVSLAVAATLALASLAGPSAQAKSPRPPAEHAPRPRVEQTTLIHLAQATPAPLAQTSLPSNTPTTVAPLATGDEPIVVTQHQIKTASGALAYEARAGRLAIRNDENGEIRG